MEKDAVDLAKLIRKANDVLADHEQRLQDLERPLDLAEELKHLRNRVEGEKDPERRKAALFCLASLCEALGIENLEK